MKSFSLGRYVPYDTWIHRLDPRIKIISIIFLMVCVFLPYDTWVMTAAMSLLAFIIIAVLLWSTKTGIRNILSSLKSMWFMVIFLLLIYVLMPRTNPVLGVAWSINGWTVYWDSFADAAKIAVRLLLMICLTTILTASTKPLDLTYAFEWYMKPLKVLKFPAHEVAMTISIALRFIPTLLDDTTRIIKAQESRGVDFSHGRIVKRLAALTSLIVPLFVSAFTRSEELANAMECRCYDPRAKRTRYRTLKTNWADWVFFFLIFAVTFLFISFCATHLDISDLFGIPTL